MDDMQIFFLEQKLRAKVPREGLFVFTLQNPTEEEILCKSIISCGNQSEIKRESEVYITTINSDLLAVKICKTRSTQEEMKIFRC